MNKEDKLRQAILKDFKELLVSEFTTNWKAERFLIEMYLSVMSLDNTMKLINEQNQQLKAIEKDHQKINGELREELQKANDTLDTHNELVNHLQEVIEEVKTEISSLMSKYFYEKDFCIEDIHLDKLLQILDKVEEN